MTLATLFIVIGAILVIAEMIAQFAFVWLLLLGCVAFLVGGLNIIYELTLLQSLIVFLIIALAMLFALYKPIKRYIRAKHTIPSHDMIGKQVEVIRPICKGKGGTVRFAGVTWKAELSENCSEDKLPNHTATISSVKDITLFVE